MSPKTLTAAAAVACAIAAAAPAQSVRDLLLVRNRKTEGEDVVQLRGGAAFGFVGGSEDPSIGLEDVVAPHGHVYFRRRGIGGQHAVLLGYAGFDGLYGVAKDDPAAGGQSQNRLEVSWRPWVWYREGFYRDDEFVPTGRYEGDKWHVLLGTSRLVDQEMRIELAGFYRRYSFARNETTAANYVVPEDFNGYGIRVTLEHDTLQIDRRSGRPDGGFLLTVGAEREQNDSSGSFGTQGIFESELPSGLWRGQGQLEWYFPHTENSTFALFVDGSVSDEEDRVYNYDTIMPSGNLTFDAQLRWRLELGGQLVVTPYVAGEFVRLLREDGFGSDNEVFLGGGLDLRWDAGDALSMFAEYSYLDTDSRRSISPTKDTLGRHQLFVGVEARF